MHSLTLPRFPKTLRFYRSMMSNASSPGPVELSIRSKLTTLLNPSGLTITNDSWQHRHHEAMRESQGNGETHFTVNIVSDLFKGKTTMQRHRLIYGALSEELSNGLHALSLKTKTREEAEAATQQLEE